jgi:hypothetical protein
MPGTRKGMHQPTAPNLRRIPHDNDRGLTVAIRVEERDQLLSLDAEGAGLDSAGEGEGAEFPDGGRLHLRSAFDDIGGGVVPVNGPEDLRDRRPKGPKT